LIETGSCERLGALVAGGGVNFAVFAPAAETVELCLFDHRGAETRLELPMQTDGVWHGFVPGLGAGQHYGFRAHGAYEPVAGLRFNPHKLLLDPYARALAGPFRWSDAVFDYERPAGAAPLRPSTLDSAPFMPKAVVTSPWPEPADRRAVPWAETLLYELNVRGFTIRHPAIDAAERGRLTALGHRDVLAHFKALGITSVELMPIHAFVDEDFLTRQGLRNFWGYNTLGFFALAPRYLGPEGLAGVRRTIETLHAAGIEVILDVVYNHTAEGGRLGPSLSFRGLANAHYYRLLPNDPSEYINDTGCGNTLNTSEPIVRQLIVDSLRYCVEALGVDGFRFDLATTLAREPHGFNPKHPLFAEIQADAVLAGVKLIAEPWDVGPAGYRLGGFPPGWAEWNAEFRDTVRRFWRQEPGIAPDLARRVHGSADIFEAGGRGPQASINLVTSHDGFTLADLVSYLERHNEANGEHNRDGHSHNFSANHGVEGESDNPKIIASRRRHRLNLLATLLLSQGTPMLLAGDELGNSQAGNNNAYAQDNPTGWIDWGDLAQDPSFFDDVCRLTQLRREVPLLRQACYRHGEPAPATGLPNIEWFDAAGTAIAPDEWPATTSLGLLLSQAGTDDDSRADASADTGADTGADTDAGAGGVLAAAILFNAGDDALSIQLPAISAPGAWRTRFSTAGADPAVTADGRLRLPGFSVVCLTYAG
jgi:isoamylase